MNDIVDGLIVEDPDTGKLKYVHKECRGECEPIHADGWNLDSRRKYAPKCAHCGKRLPLIKMLIQRY